MLEIVLRRTIIGLVLALAVAAPASAGSGGHVQVGLTFVPGSLSVQTTQVAGRQATMRIVDGRGTGAGWTLRLTSQQKLTIRSIVAQCAAGSTCTLPSAARAPSGVVVLKAAHDTGMGVIRLTVTFASAPSAAVAFAVS